MAVLNITYKQLVQNTLNGILAAIQNKDSYSSSVPANYKSGWSYADVWTNHTTTYATRSSSVIGVVSTATITNDFNQFLLDRGINSNDETLVTTKGILNFYNNVSAWVAARLTVVQGSISGMGSTTASTAKCLFYNNNSSITPKTPTLKVNTSTITNSDITSSLTDLNSTLCAVVRSNTILYDITTSCSCCSSSSCSCSCSGFIAHII